VKTEENKKIAKDFLSYMSEDYSFGSTLMYKS
jgi:hypothetical protein